MCLQMVFGHARKTHPMASAMYSGLRFPEATSMNPGATSIGSCTRPGVREASNDQCANNETFIAGDCCPYVYYRFEFEKALLLVHISIDHSPDASVHWM